MATWPEVPADPREGVVRGNAAGQAQKALQPSLVGLGKLHRLDPVVCTGDSSAQGDSQQVDELMAAGALHTGIGNLLEQLQQAQGRIRLALGACTLHQDWLKI